MADKRKPWFDWGARYRRMLKEKESSLAKVAESLELGESTLRSWTNGTREINLSDFFAICTAADLDPAIVLFGNPLMTDAMKKAAVTLATSVSQ